MERLGLNNSCAFGCSPAKKYIGTGNIFSHIFYFTSRRVILHMTTHKDKVTH